MARVAEDGALVGAREGDAQGRLPRIPSERADLDLVTGATRNLAALVRSDMVGGSRELLIAAVTAQLAVGRAFQHRDQRDRRRGDRRVKANRA